MPIHARLSLLLPLALPWIPHDDVILPADIQGMPALGLSDAADPLVEVMNRKLQLMRKDKRINITKLRQN